MNRNQNAEAEIRSYDAAAAKQGIAHPLHKADRTVNLCIKEKRDLNSPQFFLLLALILVLLAVLEYVCAFLPYRRLEAEEAALAAERSEYQQIVDGIADYDQVREDYRKYNYENFDRTIVDREEILDLFESVIFPICKVESVRIAQNTVTMLVSAVKNEEIDLLQNRLREHALVKTVLLTRTNLEEDLATVAMTIVLNDATEVD